MYCIGSFFKVQNGVWGGILVCVELVIWEVLTAVRVTGGAGVGKWEGVFMHWL